MLNMTFKEFQETNCGNADKYTSVKETNEFIYNSNKEKKENQILTMSDMKKKSEHFICTHVYDVGRGKFMTLGNLEQEMNRIK